MKEAAAHAFQLVPARLLGIHGGIEIPRQGGNVAEGQLQRIGAFIRQPQPAEGHAVESRIHGKRDDDEDRRDGQNAQKLADREPQSLVGKPEVDRPAGDRQSESIRPNERPAGGHDPARPSPGDDRIHNDHGEEDHGHQQPGPPRFCPLDVCQAVPDKPQDEEENQVPRVPEHRDGKQEDQRKDPARARIDTLHDAVADAVTPGDEHGFSKIHPGRASLSRGGNKRTVSGLSGK